MKKFDRYLLRILLISILIVLIFLLGIDFLVQSSEDADNIGKGQYSFGIMTYVLLLQIPDKIIQFLPAAILVGTIMSLGQLSTQNELTVIRTAGISRLRMAYAGIFLALSLGIGLIIIGEYIAPALTNKSELIRSQALGKTAKTAYQQGIWLTSDDYNMTHISHLNTDGSLADIMIYQQDADNNIIITEAQKALYTSSKWQLFNPIAYRLSPQSAEQITANTVWANEVTPETLISLANIHQATTLKELYTLTHFLAANHLNHQDQSLRFWQRMLLPLSTLTMLLLALPFAFSERRSGSGGVRLMIGILLGVTYYILQGILSSLALLMHWSPFLGAILPVLILAFRRLFF